MKRILIAVMGAALVAVSGQGAEWVTASGSHATLARASFPGRLGKTLVLTHVDVTSDKAGSVITWRVGDGASATVLEAAANNVTNLITGGTSIKAADVLLLQGASGLLTEKVVHSVTTNQASIVSWQQPLATNMSVGDAVYRKFASTYINMAATNLAASTNLHVKATNGFAAGEWVFCTGKVGSIHSVTATNIALTAALGVGVASNAPVVRLTRIGTNLLAAAVGATEATVGVTNAPGLAYGADIVMVPSQGPTMEADVISSEPGVTCRIALTAVTGQAMAPGDMVYDEVTETTTIVGAATLRMSGSGIYVGAPGRPASMTIDSTSAGKLNNIVGAYW